MTSDKQEFIKRGMRLNGCIPCCFAQIKSVTEL